MNLISVLRPYWKCLQSLNDLDTSITLEKYLLDWNQNYRKDIKFYTNETKPEKFELTGFYPLYSDEENQIWDKKIDELIESTDLFVPDRRTCYQTDEGVEFSCDKFSRVDRASSEINSSISAILENLAQRKVISILIFFICKFFLILLFISLLTV